MQMPSNPCYNVKNRESELGNKHSRRIVIRKSSRVAE